MASAQTAARSHLKLVHHATEHEQEGAPADRRAHRRLNGSELSWLNHARIKYGPDVSLIDLSVGGAQIETTSFPLQPGSTVVIELAAGERTWPVPARVVRCHIAALTPHATYRGAVAFKRPFDFQEIASAVESDADVNPIDEFPRLNLALQTPLSVTGTRALEAAVAMVESVRGRESAAPFVKELGRLLRVLTMAVENGADLAAVVPEIIDGLHRSVPSLTVQMVDASHASLIRTDAVFFRVPTEGSEVPDCLVIEFPPDCPLEAWHLQLLEAGAHLIAISKDLTSLQPQPAYAS